MSPDSVVNGINNFAYRLTGMTLVLYEKIEEREKIMNQEKKQKLPTAAVFLRFLVMAVFMGFHLNTEVAEERYTVVMKETRSYSGVLEYFGNLHAGKATVAVKGCGSYRGTVYTGFFVDSLELSDLKTVEVQNGDSARFTDATEFLKENVKVTYQGKTLQYGTDYVRIREYQKASGKTIYGVWSKTVKIKIQ